MKAPKVLRKELRVDQLRCSACDEAFLAIRGPLPMPCKSCGFLYVWVSRSEWNGKWKAAPLKAQPSWFQKKPKRKE